MAGMPVFGALFLLHRKRGGADFKKDSGFSQRWGLLFGTVPALSPFVCADSTVAQNTTTCTRLPGACC